MAEQRNRIPGDYGGLGLPLFLQATSTHHQRRSPVSMSGDETRGSHLSDSEILAQMVDQYSRVTAGTAAAIHIATQAFYSDNPTPSTETMDSWKNYLDGIGVGRMSFELNNLEMITDMLNGEGAKDNAPSCMGRHGKEGSNLFFEADNDVLEGTTRQTRGHYGSSSVLAAVRGIGGNQGLLKFPEERQSDYVVKFLGPPEANGVVDLDLPHETNLRNLIDVLRIDPSQLVQVTLDPNKKGREINHDFINAAESLGVQVIQIPDGDFIVGSRAVMDPKRFPEYGDKNIILVTRGGIDEFQLNAVQALCLGGYASAKEWNSDPATYRKNPARDLSHFVPGNPNTAVVCTTFINPPEWFNKEGIIRASDGSGYVTTTMITTSNGIAFKNHVISG